MRDVPAANAVTVPSLPTEAIDGLPEDQEMLRPLRTFPLASLVTADASVVCPRVRLVDAVVTVTEATGAGWAGFTVTVAVAELLPPEFVAVRV
jgi:hypothetical protein